MFSAIKTKTTLSRIQLDSTTDRVLKVGLNAAQRILENMITDSAAESLGPEADCMNLHEPILACCGTPGQVGKAWDMTSIEVDWLVRFVVL